MLIYNVTINISEKLHNDWVSWMKDTHIPDVMKTGCFTHYYFTRVLTTQPDETGFTYSIQYHCENPSNYEEYVEKSMRNLFKKSI